MAAVQSHGEERSDSIRDRTSSYSVDRFTPEDSFYASEAKDNYVIDQRRILGHRVRNYFVFSRTLTENEAVAEGHFLSEF